jgi:hypothetical protein
MKSGRRKHKETGGANEPAEDLKTDPPDRSSPNKIASEADEKKRGGRAKKAHGGKMVGKAEGKKAEMRADRKPRKSGGRTGSDGSPFSSARKGTNPPGRKEMSGVEGFGID